MSATVKMPIEFKQKANNFIGFLFVAKQGSSIFHCPSFADFNPYAKQNQSTIKLQVNYLLLLKEKVFVTVWPDFTQEWMLVHIRDLDSIRRIINLLFDRLSFALKGVSYTLLKALVHYLWKKGRINCFAFHWNFVDFEISIYSSQHSSENSL